MRMLRRITLVALLISNPPTRVAPGKPKMVLLEVTVTRVPTPEPMVPET
jgi:hypothetical protein